MGFQLTSAQVLCTPKSYNSKWCNSANLRVWYYSLNPFVKEYHRQHNLLSVY